MIKFTQNIIFRGGKQMKERLKNTKGITLVALIITIIVLLILAMVSIRLIMNGGIIGKSEKATNDYSIAEEKEQIQLGFKEYQMAQFTDTNPTLKVEGANVEGTGPWTITFAKSGRVYELGTDGKIPGGRRYSKSTGRCSSIISKSRRNTEMGQNKL